MVQKWAQQHTFDNNAMCGKHLYLHLFSCVCTFFTLKQLSPNLQPFIRHLTLTLAFSQSSAHYLPPFWPSPHPPLLFISPSLSLHLHYPSKCRFSLHNASDSQFIQWQDASISWKAEECCSVSESHLQPWALWLWTFLPHESALWIRQVWTCIRWKVCRRKNKKVDMFVQELSNLTWSKNVFC